MKICEYEHISCPSCGEGVETEKISQVGPTPHLGLRDEGKATLIKDILVSQIVRRITCLTCGLEFTILAKTEE